MRSNYLKETLKTAVLALTILLLGVGVSGAQVNLTAQPTSLTMPDGSTVPMWGYSCGTFVTGQVGTCAPLHPGATGWSPVVITVPTGQPLTINLTNLLTFTPTGSTTANTVPTSLVIVGQVGGGLGSSGATCGGAAASGGATCTASPTHAQLGVTWSTVNTPGGTNPTFTPPPQGARLQSFATEVAEGATTPLTWSTLRPGTYLLESGTHPSIQVPMGLYGILVVTTAPTASVSTTGISTETAAGTAYPAVGTTPAVTYDAEIPLAFGEIDPVQNRTVFAAVNTVGFSETKVWSGQPGGCGYPGAGNTNYLTCYPPAVNYTPLYYTINGVAFTKSNAAASLFSTFPNNTSTATGKVLVRLVNAGSRMHVPSMVGEQTTQAVAGLPPVLNGFSIIAEDGNLAPGAPKVQSDVFMAAGKTFDVMINVPASGAKALPIYDRELSLSGNAIARDAGMLAYIGVNGAGLPAAPAFAPAVANADTYNSLTPCAATPCSAFMVSDPSKGVIANDVNVYGVQLLTAPTHGTLALNANGTFAYVPSAAGTAATPDSFVYCANGSVTAALCSSGVTATVTLGAATLEAPTGITVLNSSYTSTMATYLAIKTPGVLSGAQDAAGYALTVATSTVVQPAGVTILADANGGFTATAPGAGTYTFTFRAQNSQGTLSPPATVTLTFPTPTNLQVTVLDGNDKTTQITDYRWIIEEDRSFYVNPATTANTGTTIVPTLGVNFHTSNMPFVAQGCTGAQSCEGGQTVLNPATGAHVGAVCDVSNGVCRPDTAGTGMTPVLPGEVALDPAKRYYISVLPGDAANPFYNAVPVNPRQSTTDPTQTGITGMIVTCPKYESDGKTLSPLAGQAVIANLMPGRFGVIATPGADRIARGEEWLQTNTLDGQKAHDSFVRIGEPSFFQEFGPAGYHVSIGFANPAIINSRHAAVCNLTDAFITGSNCTNTVTGRVVGERLSRTPDERLYESGSHDSFYWTQRFVSFGDADGEDFAFTKCAADGTFTLTGLPDGDWRITTFDQWNDQLVDGLSTPIRLDHTNPNSGKIGDIAATQWQTNLYTRTFMDDNKDGISQATEAGLGLLNVAVRLRDGSLENLIVTDFTGTANFNETFPLFSWYTVETDTTRYKNTGTHVVYDVGGPADGTLTTCGGPLPGAGYPPCGTSAIAKNLANTVEQVSLPTNLRVPGAVYCAGADCTGKTIQTPVSDPPSVCTTNSTGATTCSTKLSSGRIDPPFVGVEGWQGFPGQNNFIEFGKEPYAAGENGGIKGHVVYASTRPFDDPQMLVQTQWEPLVPHVTINLYQEGFALDGVTPTRTLVDTTQTTSWDDWAQGFRSNGIPNMNCPGQGATGGAIPDLFYFSLFNQPDYLDVYNNQHSGTPLHTLPNHSQFKCYDGMHNWNQITPAPYDGMYQFPSVVTRDPNTGAATTACTICVANPTGDGTVMLPAGKYVVEMVVPPGYELVKEEDKNILIGDNYIAPAVQQFAGLGSIYILPDQAAIGAEFNANNAQNSNRTLGRPITPQSEGDTGSVEVFWPCVGASRIVPDYISLFPQSHEVAPFAGATRNLCDRKEVTLADQASALAKFWVFTSAHVAAHFTGIITDDFTSEFDPFSPQFGEKFSPPNLPVSIKDWTGTEISRVYTDQWGAYDGLTYSTWEVNPPNPTGYAPTMMVTCMNDPGTGPTPDPFFNPANSQFCYVIPFMQRQTQYMDTPVVPTSAFAGAGYNNVDCAYPTLTPAIKEVDGDGIGPWVSAAGPQRLTITALGDQYVNNYAYSGPSATVAPYNQKTVLRHYGFGAAPNGAGCNGGNANAACPNVTVGGIPLHGVSWSDTTITGTVQGTAVPLCAVQQQVQYGGSTARCGELVITRADNGKQSIDTVTVTIGGSAPKHVAASASIQSAIDAAKPGDLLMIDPTCATPTAPSTPVACTTATTTHTNSSHVEILIMWKPLRLQGVGAASSIINANTHPAGKMDVWRRQVNCLFGLSLSGYPLVTPSGTTQYDPSGTYTCLPSMQFQVDRLPLEAVIGWDATQNGNMAELLQEPSLMGALEGGAITVLSKGVQFPAGSDPFGVNPTAPGLFPTGTTLLTASNCGANTTTAHNPFPGNFQCNPSSIDGLGITDSSHGGGGIFVHGWGHNIQIANNRVQNNAGTLAGGINIGQGEFPPTYTVGGLTEIPGSCQTSTITGQTLPFCFDLHVNVHHNNISLNSSTGDELFSATPAGAGGVSICNGSDYYLFNYNWVCGNLSTGDGGGVGHIGYSWNGRIEHNTIIFNQSSNPTIASNGGGLLIMGAPDVDPACGITTDADCLPPITSVNPPGDGVGPGLVINANLIMGNAAESGSGGGIRFQGVNGTDVTTFPMQPSRWYSIDVTNNIIANNVAGWDGAGISLLDALAVNIRNNTIISNDSTASSGVLFNTLAAPLASSQGSCPYGTGTQ